MTKMTVRLPLPAPPMPMMSRMAPCSSCMQPLGVGLGARPWAGAVSAAASCGFFAFASHGRETTRPRPGLTAALAATP